MRGVITCSGVIVAIALIIMIHATITGNNIREDEVNQSLDSAMDFAFDRMGDIYADTDFTTYNEVKADINRSDAGILHGFKRKSSVRR